MKKQICLGFVGVLLINIVILTGCPNPAASEPGGNLGDADLVLSGEVYEATGSETSGYTYTRTAKTGKIKASGLSTEGELKDGSFSITLAKPGTLYDLDLESYFSGWKDVKAEPSDVKYFPLILYLEGGEGLSKAEASYSYSGSQETGGSYSGETQTVYYWYVDKDVTITGGTNTASEEYDEFKTSVSWNSFSLSLQKGWNSIVLEQKDSGTASESGSYTRSYELSYRVGNPDYRWVIGGFPSFDSD
jgi:hypothetical protein